MNTPIASYRRSLPSLPLPLEVLQALAAGLPKMSDTIVAFAKPLADEFLDRRSDAVAVRSVLKLAAVIWNMTIEADERTGEAARSPPSSCAKRSWVGSRWRVRGRAPSAKSSWRISRDGSASCSRTIRGSSWIFRRA
ncbi:MAG TPA: hypothetical protein VIA18_13420 [Polyangia bacterium]|nr:hypothetical protein [Polyangia bacterium]